MLYWRCQEYHTLPEAGGLLEQDERLMDLVSACADIYHTVKGQSATDAGYLRWYELLRPHDEPREAMRKIAEKQAKAAGEAAGG